MRYALTIILAFAAAGASYADTRDLPDFTWLLLEPGSRPGGIGRTFTGIAEGGDTPYYNPGGLGLQPKNYVSVTHEPRGLGGELNDMFYDYAAASYRFGKYGVFAGSIIFYTAGRSEIRDEQNNLLGYMHSYNAAPAVHWGYPLTENLGVGVGVTYAYQHLTDQTGGTTQRPLADAGVFYRTPLKGLRVGAAFKYLNVNREQNGISYAAPRQFRLGVSYTAISNDKNDLLVAADGSKLLMNFRDPPDYKFDLARELGQGVYSGGVEYTYAKLVTARAGYYRDKEGRVTGLCLGFGVAYKGIGFDYGRVAGGELFMEQNRFGISYQF